MRKRIPPARSPRAIAAKVPADHVAEALAAIGQGKPVPPWVPSRPTVKRYGDSFAETLERATEPRHVDELMATVRGCRGVSAGTLRKLERRAEARRRELQAG